MVEIKPGIHSIDGLHHPFPGVEVVSYLVEASPHDLTLLDSCFLADLPKLEEYVHNAGYVMTDIKRIIISHLHPDHIQAVNEIKKMSGAKILSYWQEALPSCSHGFHSRGPKSGGGTRCLVATSYAEDTLISSGSLPGPLQNIMLIGIGLFQYLDEHLNNGRMFHCYNTDLGK